MLNFEYTAENNKERLDNFLVGKLGEYSRSYIQKLIKDGHVLINSSPMLSRKKLKPGDIVSVNIPKPSPTEIIPEDIPIDIVYEDECLVVINKAPGMVVHPVQWQLTGTMVNAIMYRIKNLSGIGGVLRPGIVHRLDKDTSGLIVVAKNDETHRNLSEQFRDRTTVKKYLAIVSGRLKSKTGKIDASIGRHPVDRKKMCAFPKDSERAKTALTSFRVLEEFSGFSLIELRIHTGRTHQIRVHLSSLGHPILGDTTYGCRSAKKNTSIKANRQCLHAAYLEITHPKTQQVMSFKGEIPEDINQVLYNLRK